MKYVRTPSSPARSALADAIARRANAEDEVAALQAAAAKLASAETLAAPIEAEIARLDGSEAAAMAAFARDPTAPIPLPDTEARARLIRELDAAHTTAASARRAYGPVAAEMSAANDCRVALEKEIDAATAQVIADETDSTVAEMAKTIAAANRARINVSAARALVLNLAETTQNRDAFMRLERLDLAIRGASGSPMPDLAGAHAAATAWRGFADVLKSDAAALMRAS